MSVVTPVPVDPNERAAKLWQKRQALQAVLTNLTMIGSELDLNDDLELVVANRVLAAHTKVKEAMELLAPTPKPRVTKRKPHLWDK